MATTVDNGDGSFTLSSAGHSVVVRLRSDDVTGGWISLDVEAEDHVHSEPFRLHITDSNGRIAGDFPTCNPAYCIVDDNGKITMG
jgi:hypothetical protein